MKAPIHPLHAAHLRLLSGCQAAAVILGLILLVCVAGLAQAGPTHELMAEFHLPPKFLGHGTLALGPDGCYWGTTSSGGAYGCGTIYKVNANTGALTTVVDFTDNGASNRGSSPDAGLVSDGAGFLWGTTYKGGASSNGTVFKVNVLTGTLTTVVEFTDNGAANRGASPRAGLVSDGAGSFWGTTRAGGVGGFGTVFKVNATTGTLTTVVEFTLNGASNRGAFPQAELVSDGAGFFWGTTILGGANNCGTVFKVNATTGELTTVVDFTDNGSSNKGAGPSARLVNDGAGFLWGTTIGGGASSFGTVFKVNASTGTLTTVAEFTYDAAGNTGTSPQSELVSDGFGSFWGTTFQGGANGYGTVFKVNASTGELTTVVDFTDNGPSNKGAWPLAGLVSDGAGYFWGTTNGGGANNFGTVFKVNASTGALTTVVDLGPSKGASPYAGLVSDGSGSLWGTTGSGGANNFGTIFKMNARTGALTTVVAFTGNGASNKGAHPQPSLVSDGAGYFWGTTSHGGSFGNYGTVFKVNANTGVLTTVAEFTGNWGSNKGVSPNGALVSDGLGNFWGTTVLGGAGNYGTVFKVNASTGTLTTVLEFTNNGTNNRGASPFAGLVSDGVGSFWGTTHSGGAFDVGTVFKVNANTGELTTVVEFTRNGASNKGAYPYAELVSDGAGSFWGTTSAGGTPSFVGNGTVFKVNASTGTLTTVVEFTLNGASNRGAFPKAGLVSDGAGFLWGTTENGGPAGYGTVFKVNANTGALTTILEFTGSGSQTNTGASPGQGALLKHTDGNFYGTTQAGGPGGAGTIFCLRFGLMSVTQPANGITASGAVLNGTVNPDNDGAATASFQYGTNPDLDGAATVSAGTVANGAAALPVSVTLTGLKAHTTYYYRVVANNVDSDSHEGRIVSFMTSNTAPVASDVSANATGGDAQTIAPPFSTTDVDGDAVMLTSVTAGSGLTLNGFSGSHVTFTPVYGFTGTSSLSYTVEDAFGGTATGTITVTVGKGEQVTEQLFTKGAAVPGAGVPGSGIPAGATWNSFGVPAINGAGELAFVATLTLSPGSTLTGIFAGPPEAPVLLVKKGDAAPGATGAVFASFKDPLFNETGRVAFVANLSGAGVTGANNSGIWTNALGSSDTAPFQLVARKGGSVPGVDRARWKSFSSVALASEELNLVGAMASGAGGVTPASDLVLCRYPLGMPDGELLLREGLRPEPGAPALKSFATLTTVSGSPGQRRQPLEGGLHVKATWSNGQTSLLNNIGAAGLSQWEAFTGATLVDDNSQPAGTLASLGFAADASGSAWGSVFRAALKGDGTSAADNAALVSASADGLSILARKGEEADPERAPGALIKAFASDPVAGAEGYAAVVTLSGEGASKSRDTALLWRGNNFSGILAREGDPAPGAGGALYGSFVSVALPDGAGGPVFVARLVSAKADASARVTARNDLGLWATDTNGAVRLLLREGAPLDGTGKPVKSFVALPVVLGSAAQARSYNDAGKIAVKVTFSDGSQAIVRIRVP